LKRDELERHLRAHGRQLYREGGKHSVWWNPASRKSSAVPPSLEIADPKIS
jgi:mRNA interferase HicA